MTAETLRTRLEAGRPAIGAWLGIPHPLSAEAMASQGFHWLAVDMEHAGASVDQTLACFVAAERHGCVPLARLPSADPYLARRLLDGGAQGLIIPVVQSAEDWAAFSVHCLYPPHGRRGVGLSRCNGWGDRFQDYLTTFRPFLVPQIETRQGAEQAAAIAARPEVDALFLGPYDLSADLGAAGDFETAPFKAAIARVRTACDVAGKPCGIHQVAPEPAQLEARIAEGFRFIAYSTDVIAMRTALAGAASLL
ncbi:HpcH/HpaI aldolase family protein [Magnetospirillum aberrantis]|uniref:2,4-dihydroxyhept-2-ene-1,7-dioic acid aldolase n=1 Tax=Magnetospirillum aberrantis SpK TaxID=908842 RepID=A0A7C9QVD4_9PROT|nr:aldolase/citrate lyase family protein [Magnetospirillum aberrantis]NFV81540.1 2,4-dihydroxyhept-2-ene-1,7-dioic acid aldolase [Magnetospirillum aberrantis SpK]